MIAKNDKVRGPVFRAVCCLAAAAALSSCGSPIAGIFGYGGVAKEAPQAVAESTSAGFLKTLQGGIYPYQYTGMPVSRSTLVVGDELYFVPSYTSNVYDGGTSLTTYTWNLYKADLAGSATPTPSLVLGSAQLTSYKSTPVLAYVPGAGSVSGKDEILFLRSRYALVNNVGSYTSTLQRVVLDTTASLVIADFPQATNEAITSDPLAMAVDAQGNVAILLDAFSNSEQAKVVYLDKELNLKWSFDFVNNDFDWNEGSIRYRYESYYQPLSIAFSTDGAKIFLGCKGSGADNDSPWDGVYVLDVAKQGLDGTASVFDRGVFSRPAILASGADGSLYSYSYLRQAVEIHGTGLGLQAYATDSSWLHGSDAYALSGSEDIVALVPGDGAVSVLTLDTGGTQLRERVFASGQ